MREPVILTMDGSTHVSTAALLTLGRAGSGGPAAGGAKGATEGRANAATEGRWQVLARRFDADSHGQARVLLRLVDEMLHETGHDPRDIAAIVAGVGPGTFTGVRIAVATARGLALALEVPVLGASTPSALAAQTACAKNVPGDTDPEIVIPVVDARRGQVFYGVYRRVSGTRSGASPVRGEDHKAAFERLGPFAVCDRDALLAALPRGLDTLIIGDTGVLGAPANGAGGVLTGTEDGVEVVLRPMNISAENLVVGQSGLREPGSGVEGHRLDAWLSQVVGSGATEGGRRVWKAGEPGSPEAVRPIYVRSPDADIHITKMKDPWADAAGER